jgi:hypothetical protein
VGNVSFEMLCCDWDVTIAWDNTGVCHVACGRAVSGTLVVRIRRNRRAGLGTAAGRSFTVSVCWAGWWRGKRKATDRLGVTDHIYWGVNGSLLGSR